MPRDKRVTRVVYGAFVTLAAAFILSSVWQIASQVFGLGSAKPPEARHLRCECAGVIEVDLHAIDAALAEPTPALAPDEAVSVYQRAKKRGWQDEDTLARGCTGDPAGSEAIAALLRFDRAAEAGVRLRSAELGPVRREVESFIR